MADVDLPLVERVLKAAEAGTRLVGGPGVPDEGDMSRSVPPEAIREALEGENRPLHWRGLRLQNFCIEGDLDLSYMRWQGELSLVNCRITGNLILDHARPVGRVCLDGSHIKWVSALNAVVDGTFSLRNSTLHTGFYALGIRVSESLNLRNSEIVGPESKPRRLAVELYRASIGDLFVSHSRIDGGIYAAGMKVARNVRIQGSCIRSRANLGWQDEAEFSGAVTLAGSEVGGSIYVSTASTRGGLKLGGQLQLSSVSCRQIFIHPEVFREALIGLDGLSYTRLRGTTPRELLRELMASPDLQRQAFVQLAAYCQSVGDVTTRRRVLIGLEKRITAALPLVSPARIIRVMHQALVGYGYRPSRALPWLLLCMLCAALLIHWHGTFLVPKRTLDVGTQGLLQSPPSLSASVAVTLDSFLPFAALGVKDGYSIVASSSVEWVWLSLFLALKFGAWVLAALA